MFLLNDKPISPDTAFTHEGIQYPNNWLRLASPAERAAIGITEVDDPVRADDRFYWDGDISNPKQLNDEEITPEDGQSYTQRGLKSAMIAQVKYTAGTLLAKTDWMVIRRAERDVAIPADVVARRAAIVAEAARLEVAIAAVASVDALIGVMNGQQWGE